LTQIYAPDFVGKSDQAVVFLVSSLNEELKSVMERVHRGEQVVYRFEWNLAKDSEQKDMIVFALEFADENNVSIGLAPQYWECLPSVISLGLIVIMTDPGLINEENRAAVGEEPRALVIHSAFNGLDGLAEQANQRLQAGERGNLDFLLRLLSEGAESDEKPHH